MSEKRTLLRRVLGVGMLTLSLAVALGVTSVEAASKTRSIGTNHAKSTAKPKYTVNKSGNLVTHMTRAQRMKH